MQTLPTVQALQDLWSDVSKKTLYAPPYFFKYLRLRYKYRLKFLDPNRVRFIGPIGKINDCSACYNSCCVSPHSTVLLRLKDIATLIDIQQTHLITKNKPQFSKQILEKKPALHKMIRSEAWSIFPVLKQNSYGACFALSSEGKCQLHPYWPMSCARFPYSLSIEDESVFYSQRCDAYWIHPSLEPKALKLQHKAVDAYNERIKDIILLSYMRQSLQELGLLHFLSLPA